MAKRKAEHAVTRYARAVVRGRIVAGKWVRLACERHLDDLKFGHGRSLSFDEQAADHAIEFFGFLRHSKGEWAGQRFRLESWQAFIIGSIFGWKRADGMRRFSKAFVEVARKNGKSTLIAGVGLYLLVADNEPGAEVYTAATKRDQARITHSEATRMVKRSPELRRRVKAFRDNLSIEGTASKYEPLGADSDTCDGLNIHGALIDEVHAHKTRGMVDVLHTATGSRRQPLVFEITTAGLQGESIYSEHHDYSENVLQATVKDDAWFAYVATMDEGDDWTKPRIWKKANPNLGVSVKIDDLREHCQRARVLPAAQNAFLRLRMDVRTQQISRWLDLMLWDENAGIIDEEALRGRQCYGGLDLDAVDDLTAWVMGFPEEDDPETVGFLCRFWCPAAKLHDAGNRYAPQYQAWVRQGFLKTTPGDAIDYEFVREEILRDAERFEVVDLAVDRLFQAHQLSMELESEGLRVAGMGQGFLSMAAPTKEFQHRLLRRKVRHGGNPILRWMAGGVAVKEDPAGNIKVDKGESSIKVDGIVASIMAMSRVMVHTSAFSEAGAMFV